MTKLRLLKNYQCAPCVVFRLSLSFNFKYKSVSTALAIGTLDNQSSDHIVIGIIERNASLKMELLDPMQALTLVRAVDVEKHCLLHNFCRDRFLQRFRYEPPVLAVKFHATIKN